MSCSSSSSGRRMFTAPDRVGAIEGRGELEMLILSAGTPYSIPSRRYAGSESSGLKLENSC